MIVKSSHFIYNSDNDAVMDDYYIVFRGEKMKLLEDKIKQDGIAVNEHILKVDSFINHQVDRVFDTCKIK